MRRALVAICLAVLASLLIFDPAAAETKRRTVNVYNWSDYIDPTVIADFTKATGIAVRYDTFDSNDVLEAKLLAGRTGYDVVAPTAYFLERQIKAGVFARLDKSKLPNLAHMWPEITRRLAQYDPDNLYGVNYMWGTTGIGYNQRSRASFWAATAGLTAGMWCSSPSSSPSSRTAACTCSTHPTISCRRRCTISALIPTASGGRLSEGDRSPGAGAPHGAQVPLIRIYQRAGQRRDLLRGGLFR
jgi:putrescine transport system substrate-binding protein